MNPWPILTSAKRASVALERRADALLRARGLDLTQLRLLVDIDDRRTAYSAQLAGDLLMSRQAVHHQLLALRARGALDVGPAGAHVRRLILTPEGRDLASRGLDDLAPLLDRLATRTDADTIISVLSGLEAATRPATPRWQL
jgi:DNA-binding MarR family transcriptional regulator